MRSNKYAGTCATCGSRVEAETGVLTNEDNVWVVRHANGQCTMTVIDEVGTFTPADADKVMQVVSGTTAFTPTSEQLVALDLFNRGESMVIEAGAGTGKTATLKLLAESTTKRVQYVAFNKAIVTEASMKFPRNVACNTAHSLAFRSVGKRYQHRLNSARMSSSMIAHSLGIKSMSIWAKNDEGQMEKRTLAPDFLAGRVMQAVSNFCHTADLEPERRHFPYIDGIDAPTADGRRTFRNNDEVASAMMSFVATAWADLQDVDGQLRFTHDHYLKIWQLSNPRINADVILFDEAQDANPVMAAVVGAQDHAQVVYVGDSQQAIYEFTGAVNTLERIASDHRCFLTQSFRFGPAVANVANLVLERLGAELRLVGTPSINSQVGFTEREDAILFRTNAAAVAEVLALREAGRRPHLVGGGSEVVAFAKAARDLMQRGSTSHPELACFDTWEGVKHYVANDPAGSELRLLVKLVDDFTVETILQALDNMPAERNADVIVSTAHKSKGREWDTVRLGGDFPVEDEEVAVGEMRLIYVAVTRAKLHLDYSSISAFFNAGSYTYADLEFENEPEHVDVIDDAATRWVDGVEEEV